MTYKVIKGPKGGKRYMKDARFISAKDIPPDELIKLNLDMENVGEPIEPVSKECIFCGAFANRPRLYNQQAIPLCEAHYYSETMGKIAQRVRETANA
jgi:hypothetical protein